MGCVIPSEDIAIISDLPGFINRIMFPPYGAFKRHHLLEILWIHKIREPLVRYPTIYPFGFNSVPFDIISNLFI